MNKIVIVVMLGVLLLATIFAVSGFAIANTDAKVPTEVQKTGCGSCNGQCSATSNCGLATCGAATGGTCGCGKQ
jgi:hypothetical protein